MQNLNTIIMQLSTEGGLLGKRAANLIVQMAEQWELDKNFRLKYQEAKEVPIEPDAKEIYRNAMNTDYGLDLK